MQLILDSETTADINEKMTTLEETLERNMKDPVESRKNEISNGNKENIESQQNIVDDAVIVGEDLKPCSNDSSEMPLESVLSNDNSNEVKENLSNKVEDVTSNQTSSEHKNGDVVHENLETNGDKMECEDSASSASDRRENILEETVHGQTQDTRLSCKENNGMDFECVESKADKLISTGNVTEDVEIKQKEDEDTDLDDTNSKNLIIENKMDEDLIDEETKILEPREDNILDDDSIIGDLEALDTETEENMENDSIVKALESLESEAEGSPVPADNLQIAEKIKESENFNIEEKENNSVATKELEENIEDIQDTPDGKESEKVIDGVIGSGKIDDDELKKTVDGPVEKDGDQLEQVVVDILGKAADNVEKVPDKSIVTKAHDQLNLVVLDQIEKVVGDHVDNEADDQLKRVIVDELDKVVDDDPEIEAHHEPNVVVQSELEKFVQDHVEEQAEDQLKPVIEDKLDEMVEDHAEKASDDQQVVADATDKVADSKLEEVGISVLDKLVDSEIVDTSELQKVANGSDGGTVIKSDDKLEKAVDEKALKILPTVLPTEETTKLNHMNECVEDSMECDVSGESQSVKDTTTPDKEQIVDVDKVKEIIEIVKDNTEVVNNATDKPIEAVEVRSPSFCKLSNTLDILSDDDDDISSSALDKNTPSTEIPTDKQCINIEDDDDIMLIDEDTDTKSNSEPIEKMDTEEKKEVPVEECTIDLECSTENVESKKEEISLPDIQKDLPEPETENSHAQETIVKANDAEEPTIFSERKEETKKPLVAENFLKGCKKNLSDMTRDELEEFCILKIVEGIVDRSNLCEIKTKLKTMSQGIEEFKKKAMMLTKQNRDLQLVLKSVQEEQKKKVDTAIIPLKITRSVGMQVLMTEKPNMRKKGPNVPANTNSNINTRTTNNRNPTASPRQPSQPKPATNNQQIPVPRLVPANNPTVKAPTTTSQTNTNSNTPKAPSNQAINGMKVQTPQKAEKRPHNRVQSVTVDLTDDEPPLKVTPRSSPAPPVRIVSPQNLLARPQFAQSISSPRKVYIPISGPQSQNIRPGQTIMLKSVPPPSGAPGQRVRGPSPRMPQNAVRMTRVQHSIRHPAPLPECLKQYQPPNWKALPPAPDLKLSKVENGIVISWKIEGYQEDSYEEIASYQLYAYQETNSPPSTALWKKIGDVKALPLPMACTLTQFMAGFKYYFAVRAVDIRSRLGPFSLPGSILLLNKM